MLKYLYRNLLKDIKKIIEYTDRTDPDRPVQCMKNKKDLTQEEIKQINDILSYVTTLGRHTAVYIDLPYDVTYPYIFIRGSNGGRTVITGKIEGNILYTAKGYAGLFIGKKGKKIKSICNALGVKFLKVVEMPRDSFTPNGTKITY